MYLWIYTTPVSPKANSVQQSKNNAKKMRIRVSSSLRCRQGAGAAGWEEWVEQRTLRAESTMQKRISLFVPVYM